VECAAAEGKVCSGGEIGVPLAEYVPPDFSFAEEEGMGNQLWAAVGLAGSSGGAFRLFFGTDETGWACRTSFCHGESVRIYTQCMLEGLPNSSLDPGTSTRRRLLPPPSFSDTG
jgi:hypothetical protein